MLHGEYGQQPASGERGEKQGTKPNMSGYKGIAEHAAQH
jgi:hypothetical protein